MWEIGSETVKCTQQLGDEYGGKSTITWGDRRPTNSYKKSEWWILSGWRDQSGCHHLGYGKYKLSRRTGTLAGSFFSWLSLLILLAPVRSQVDNFNNYHSARFITRPDKAVMLYKTHTAHTINLKSHSDFANSFG